MTLDGRSMTPDLTLPGHDRLGALWAATNIGFNPVRVRRPRPRCLNIDLPAGPWYK
jgi:hypothetical protein